MSDIYSFVANLETAKSYTGDNAAKWSIDNAIAKLQYMHEEIEKLKCEKQEDALSTLAVFTQQEISDDAKDAEIARLTKVNQALTRKRNDEDHYEYKVGRLIECFGQVEKAVQSVRNRIETLPPKPEEPHCDSFKDADLPSINFPALRMEV